MHTQGNWGRNIRPASKYPVIFAGRNTHVCQVISKGLPEEEIEANCDLIAAAPELLAACKRALFVLESPALPQHLINGAGVLATLRAAIAQAERD